MNLKFLALVLVGIFWGGILLLSPNFAYTQTQPKGKPVNSQRQPTTEANTKIAYPLTFKRKLIIANKILFGKKINAMFIYAYKPKDLKNIMRIKPGIVLQILKPRGSDGSQKVIEFNEFIKNLKQTNSPLACKDQPSDKSCIEVQKNQWIKLPKDTLVAIPIGVFEATNESSVKTVATPLAEIKAIPVAGTFVISEGQM